MSDLHNAAPEFVRAMGPVARELMGEPTEDTPSKGEIRFGSRGSFAVKLDAGTWFDHEANEGGGVLALVMRQKRVDKDGAVDWLRKQGHLAKPAAPRIVARYPYTDAAGNLLFEVCRFEPKDFRQRRPDGSGGWVWKMAGVQRVIYRLPAVAEAIAAGALVYVVEGEKAADALSALGVSATCSPGGANKWRAEYAVHLAGADVVILPDNDEPGRSHGAMVAASLRHAGVNSVRIVNLPNLPEKGDVADWIAASGTAADLAALVANAQEPGLLKSEEMSNHAGEEADAAAQKAADDCAIAIGAAVADFNSRYLVVNEAGKATILQPGYDPVLRRRHYDRLSVRDLHTLYMNQMILVGFKEKGEPIYRSKSEVWLRHRDRRQFINGVTFDPSTTTPRPGVLNLWEGYAVKPVKGDWSRLRRHIGEVVCDRDEIRYAYLMGWMARMVQHPGQQGETAVVMKGGEGTGKGTLAKALLKITGQHGLAISNTKHLVGNFNGHLRDAVFIFADEAFFAGDKASIGTLKSLITEPYLTVEAKFQNAVQQPNFLHVMMASNEEWVVPASLDARRFFVLEVSDTRKGDHAYFSAIQEQMDAGGYEAMLHDLLAMDLRNFNVRAVPVTEGLQHQRSLSLPIPESWWKDCLERSYVFRSKLGLEEHFAQWSEEATTELLFASYMEFASAKHDRHPMSRETMGRFMRRMGCKSRRFQNLAVGEHMTDETTNFGGTQRKAKVVKQPRPMGYHIGTLTDARDAFTAETGLALDRSDENDGE